MRKFLAMSDNSINKPNVFIDFITKYIRIYGDDDSIDDDTGYACAYDLDIPIYLNRDFDIDNDADAFDYEYIIDVIEAPSYSDSFGFRVKNYDGDDIDFLYEGYKNNKFLNIVISQLLDNETFINFVFNK